MKYWILILIILITNIVYGQKGFKSKKTFYLESDCNTTQTSSQYIDVNGKIAVYTLNQNYTYPTIRIGISNQHFLKEKSLLTFGYYADLQLVINQHFDYSFNERKKETYLILSGGGQLTFNIKQFEVPLKIGYGYKNIVIDETTEKGGFAFDISFKWNDVFKNINLGFGYRFQQSIVNTNWDKTPFYRFGYSGISTVNTNFQTVFLSTSIQL